MYLCRIYIAFGIWGLFGQYYLSVLYVESPPGFTSCWSAVGGSSSLCSVALPSPLLEAGVCTCSAIALLAYPWGALGHVNRLSFYNLYLLL